MRIKKKIYLKSFIDKKVSNYNLFLIFYKIFRTVGKIKFKFNF